MKTLPFIPLEKIVQQLTPQDLARCSAACRGWREVFNQDWLWQPHCDPELEEPLRTIPSVATPTFVTPEVENSTLSPICRWRLAFMRETHLWNNMKILERSRWYWEDSEHIINLKNANKDTLGVTFVTDTFIVVFHTNYIEMMDDSKKPEVSVAKTESYVNVGKINAHGVIGTNMLYVDIACSLEVYSIDLTNKLITLKHCIPLTPFIEISPHLTQASETIRKRPYLVYYGHKLYIWDKLTSNMNIFDLNTGKLSQTETFPLIVDKTKMVFKEIRGSPSSEFVIVAYGVFDEDEETYYSNDDDDESESCRYRCCIYSMNQFIFLPDLVIDILAPRSKFKNLPIALHDHWLAYIEGQAFTVYNFQTRQFLLRHELYSRLYDYIYVCDNSFIFLEMIWDGPCSLTLWLRKYSPQENLLRTLGKCELDYLNVILQIRNCKALIVVGEEYIDDINMIGSYCLQIFKYLRISSGEKMKEFKLPYDELGYIYINQSSTRLIIKKVYGDNPFFVHYLW